MKAEAASIKRPTVSYSDGRPLSPSLYGLSFSLGFTDARKSSQVPTPRSKLSQITASTVMNLRAFAVWLFIAFVVLFCAPSAYKCLRLVIHPDWTEHTIGGFSVYVNKRGTIVSTSHLSDTLGQFRNGEFHLGYGNDQYAIYVRSAQKGSFLFNRVRSLAVLMRFDCQSWQVRPLHMEQYPDYFLHGEPFKTELPERMLHWYTPAKGSGQEYALMAACNR